MQRIGALEEENQVYKKQLENLNARIHPDTIDAGLYKSIYRYIPAGVIQNQIYETNNYILLNKGSNDGITEDMGVVSVKGIVGVVMSVTPHYARVIPVINSGLHPTCFIKNTRFLGTLFWEGKDPRYVTLSRLPSHTIYSIGDTVVTSGYSAFFPQGIYVGVIESAFKQKNEEHDALKVRLFTDFSTLSDVFIIRNPLREERMQIEKGGRVE